MASSGDPRGYYRALGVGRGATPDEIRAAFRERAKVLHPDRAAAAEDEAGFRELAEAYAVLRDPRRRLQYDAEALGGGQAVDPAAAAAAGPHGPMAAGRAAARPARPEPPHDDEAAARRRGERPQRVGPAPPHAPPAPATVWVAATVVMALLLAGGAGMLWRMRAAVAERDLQLAELNGRFETLAASERELRARLEAQAVAGADAPGADRAERAGRTLFGSDIPFQPGSADLDRPLEIMIDAAVVELSRALRSVPADEPWLVVVEAYAGSAADDAGVAVAAWETALLRLGAVVERLIAQGFPAERLATGFHAGFAAGEDMSVVELKLVCCNR